MRKKRKCACKEVSKYKDPKECVNYRLNPSLMIQYKPFFKKDDYSSNDNNNDNNNLQEEYKNIQIDVGKTFREGMLRWYPHYE